MRSYRGGGPWRCTTLPHPKTTPQIRICACYALHLGQFILRPVPTEVLSDHRRAARSMGHDTKRFFSETWLSVHYLPFHFTARTEISRRRLAFSPGHDEQGRAIPCCHGVKDSAWINHACHIPASWLVCKRSKNERIEQESKMAKKQKKAKAAPVAKPKKAKAAKKKGR
jgi:hypothetical protein